MIRRWTAHKWQWINTAATPTTARTRAKEIRRANEALQPMLVERREQYLAERASMARQLRGETVWSSRNTPSVFIRKQLYGIFCWHLWPGGSSLSA